MAELNIRHFKYLGCFNEKKAKRKNVHYELDVFFNYSETDVLNF